MKDSSIFFFGQLSSFFIPFGMGHSSHFFLFVQFSLYIISTILFAFNILNGLQDAILIYKCYFY